MIIYNEKQYELLNLRALCGEGTQIFEKNNVDPIVHFFPVILILGEEMSYEPKNSNQLIIRYSCNIAHVTTPIVDSYDAKFPKAMSLEDVLSYYLAFKNEDVPNNFDVYNFDYFYYEDRLIEALISKLEGVGNYKVAVYSPKHSQYIIDLIDSKFDFVISSTDEFANQLKTSKYLTKTLYINTEPKLMLKKGKEKGDVISIDDCHVNYMFMDKRDNNFLFFGKILKNAVSTGCLLKQEDVLSSDVEYNLISNGSDKLVVIFGSCGPYSHIKAPFGTGKYENELNYFRKRYEMGMCMFGSEYDYLLINDNNNGLSGWYVVDSNERVIEKYQVLLNRVITSNGYMKDNIIFLGSSKGGYGALVHGILNENCKNIFAIVPQIEVKKYILENIEKNNISPLMVNAYEATVLNNKLFDEVDREIYLLDKGGKNINIFSCKTDASYLKILEFKSQDVRLWVSNEEVKHHEFVPKMRGLIIEIFNKIMGSDGPSDTEKYYHF